MKERKTEEKIITAHRQRRKQTKLEGGKSFLCALREGRKDRKGTLVSRGV